MSKKEVHECAVEQYLRDYRGDNEFLRSVREYLRTRHRLTPKQHDAVHRSMLRVAGIDPKVLWRDCVKLAHPDLGTDEGDRRWRERFTKIANSAYEERDMVRLHWLYAMLEDE